MDTLVVTFLEVADPCYPLWTDRWLDVWSPSVRDWNTISWKEEPISKEVYITEW